MDLGLADRVYLLTGASKGLGYATAEALVADGARVVVSARDAGRVAAAAERLGGPAHATGIAADLTDPDVPGRLIDTAMTTYGRVDGALISVGGPPHGATAATTDEQWRSAFETVFLGSVRMMRTVAEALPAGGAIAVVLSSSVRSPLGGLGLSNGLRPGLAMVAKELSDEYAPRGVRIVSLLPGRLLTDRNLEMINAASDPERAMAETSRTIPLRRLGEPAEFGRVAAFLLSPAAGYVTGIAVPVDGGLLRTP